MALALLLALGSLALTPSLYLTGDENERPTATNGEGYRRQNLLTTGAQQLQATGDSDWRSSKAINNNKSATATGDSDRRHLSVASGN